MKAHNVKTITIELEVEVEFNFYPGSPGRMYMPNGDPGYPPEPDELEVLSVALTTAEGKADILPYLTEAYVEELETRLLESSYDEGEPDDGY